MKFLCLYVFMLFGIWSGLSQQDDKISYETQLKASKSLLQNSDATTFNTILTEELVQKIFPYWYGTPWDYNGYTNVPNSGVVACGYFVSTTIKHIGFNLNRYDIAKMYSSDIVKVLCFEDYWVESNFDKFIERMKTMDDGLYIIGLSNHVGIIQQFEGRTYFIHSNYIGYNGVEKELALTSEALKSSTSFWVGNFSNNSKLAEVYLSKEELKKID